MIGNLKKWCLIYIDRDPTDPYKGWGWVEVSIETIEKFGIPTGRPETYIKLSNSKELWKTPNRGFLRMYKGKVGSNKFRLNIDGEILTIRAQKSLTVQAVCAWVKTWATPNTKITTPSNRVHSLDTEKITYQVHYVYFILNEDSNAIKIGRARDVSKRMKALQTSSPAKLILLKTVKVETSEQAHQLEQSLHAQFGEIRLAGEWFRGEAHLYEHIQKL